MIEILVKAFDKNTCETREVTYKVDTIEEYVTKVKPRMFKVWEMCGKNLELLAEYIKVNF